MNCCKQNRVRPLFMAPTKTKLINVGFGSVAKANLMNAGHCLSKNLENQFQTA